MAAFASDRRLRVLLRVALVALVSSTWRLPGVAIGFAMSKAKEVGKVDVLRAIEVLTLNRWKLPWLVCGNRFGRGTVMLLQNDGIVLSTSPDFTFLML